MAFTKLRGRRTKVALFAAVPFATVAVLGLTTGTASATFVNTNICEGSGWVCFYTDQNLTPTDDILSVKGTESQWQNLPNAPGRCQSDWNDCATSLFDHQPSGFIAVWKDQNCGGTSITYTHGTRVNNMGAWSDVVSSSELNSTAGSC